MTQYFARVVSGVAVEIIILPDDVKPDEAFHADIAATLVAATPETAQGDTYASGAFGPAPAPPAPTKSDLIVYAASKRFEVETGGIVVSGATIDTSRESQSMIANAHAYIVASGSASVAYKADSGWVTLDAATVTAVALAVGAHVQTCFALEQTLDAEITAGTITTTAQIDAAAWAA